MERRRRADEALQAVDGLLQAHLQRSAVGGRPLANLAATMAIDYSGADRGVLLVAGGDGLEPILALRQDLRASSNAGYDHEVVEEAQSSQSTVERDGRLAAPILVEGTIRGVLYLEVERGQLGPESSELATGIATRIGTLLRSAQLVDELSRRTENLELLEALGACLATGRLTPENLERAVDGALGATRSRKAVLGLLDGGGELRELVVRGEAAETLRATGRSLAERLGGGGDTPNIQDLLNDRHLFHILRAGLVPAVAADSLPRPVGFLAMWAAPDAYSDADRTFFNALAHLLEGALARQEYFQQAAEDPLTETGSRLALNLKLAEAQSIALKTGSPFSVILLDVDHFKEINDRYGHLVGDEVLKELGALMRSRLRADDAVARYGGDEFVLILPMTDAVEASHLAAELRDLARRKRFTDSEIELALSMGVSTFLPEADSVRAVLKMADDALYASKTAGRDRMTVAGEPD